MKRIIVIAAVLPVLSKAQVIPDTTTRPAAVHSSKVNPIPSAYASGTKVNYVRTWEASKPFTSESTMIDTARTVGEVKQTTVYVDGLGRPIQTVAKKISPTEKDMISPIVYDAFGREVFKYLPYTQITGTSDGKFKTDPFNAQSAFYYNGTFNPGAVGEQIFYSKTKFESSPLMRPDTVFAPGNNWGGSHIGTSMKYEVNMVMDSVRIWDISMTIGSSPTSPGIYGIGQLYKTVTTDENGMQVIEYKDKSGHIILKKVQLTASPSIHHTGWLCTYYVYDDFGSLRFVIPPKAVEAIAGAGLWSIASTVRDELCFRYEYDERKRMIIKKVPGAGEVKMVYDARDRIVMMQDGNYGYNEWLVTQYDDLNRAVRTYKWLDQVDQGWEEHRGYSIGNVVYPTLNGTPELLTEIYYDDYSWVSGSSSGLSSSLITTNTLNTNYFYSASSTSPYPQAITATNETWGMATGNKVKVLGTSNYLYSVSFYDDRGRVIQAHSTNYSGGKDTATMQYDFSGKLLRTLVCHEKAGTNSQRLVLLTKNDYDNAGRLITTKKKVNSSPEATIAEVSYDELDQLKQKKLGRKRDESNQNNYTSTPMETLDCIYNIRGWLRGINKDYARGNGTKWFGMELSYDVGFTQDQLNGNIAGIRWQSTGSDEQRSYGFSYDAVNRLMKGDFTQKNGSYWNTSAGIDLSMKMGDGSDPTTAYDANGNILAMWQKGLKIGSSATIDSLTYAYQNSSNKLAEVTDGITADNKLGDFFDVNAASDDYTYDANGNMDYDRNKSISRIIYNYLNLPDSIRVLGKGTIKYTYDATGNKLAKKIVDSTVGGTKTTITKYLGGFVYQNDTLQFVTHEEGRIREKRINCPDTMYYDYFIKDHLGNVRMVLTDELKSDAYLATMETASNSSEDLLFNNRLYIVSKPECFDVDTTNQKVQKLGPIRDYNPVVGVGKVLKVMAGDIVKPKVFGWYDAGETDNDPSLSDPIAEIVANMFAEGIVNSKAKSNAVDVTSSVLAYGISEFFESQENYSDGEGAYLNYILLDDETFKPIDFGFVSLMELHNGGGCFEEKAILQFNEGEGVEISRNGYLYIYVSNTNTVNPVYFDNLHIEHVRGPLLEENHYYPLGLTMAGISSKAASNAPANSRKFNDGSELEREEFSDNSGLDLYSLDFRNYDPQIGRFIQIDPLSFLTDDISPYVFALNNPILFNDPTGLTADSTNAPGFENTRGGTKNELEPVVVTSKGKKLEGGPHGGKRIGEIVDHTTGIGSGVVKRKYTNDNLVKTLDGIANDLEKSAEWRKLVGAIAGGSTFFELPKLTDLKKIVQNIKNKNLKAKPSPNWLLFIAATALYADGLSKGARADQIKEVVNSYIRIHSTATTDNPSKANGMYVIINYSVSGGTGGAAYYATHSYYDVSTGKFLGIVTDY